MTKAECVIREAEAHMGCPYVYGTWGQLCTTALRKRYASYNPKQREITYKRCPVLSGKQSKCDGCKYQGMLAYDCRGFTHWILKQVGIEITGQAVGTQWSGDNWTEKGEICRMQDLVCCVFIKSGGKWKHTGLHIGGGKIIHCSGEVKRDTVGGDRDWTHYAIPRGLYTDEEIKQATEGRPIIMRTLKRGSQGDDVCALQDMLNGLGYDCGLADGIYGARTEAAVRSYQQARGMTADGIAGTQTQMALAADAAKPAPVQQGELPEDDDELDTPINIVPLTYTEAAQIREALRTALQLIERAIR